MITAVLLYLNSFELKVETIKEGINKDALKSWLMRKGYTEKNGWEIDQMTVTEEDSKMPVVSICKK